MSASVFVNAASHVEGWPTAFKVVYFAAALSLCVWMAWVFWKGSKKK